mmetsp:Transcript_30829/g.52855  ORF Transcript_30829/g.52855 Transcript_30829/m.52855 type:complete len:376 (-) Transcript_30829:646-1773(-)
MGSGASTLHDEDTKRDVVRELYAPKPDLSSGKIKKKSRLPLKVISLGFINDDTSTTLSQRSNSIDSNVAAVRPFQLSEDSASISTATKLNTALMKRLVYETVPDFLSYTVDDPTGSDLEAANAARQMLVSPNNYLEFYTTVYENLHDASAKYSFSIRTIMFKNDFLTELMRMVVLESPSKVEYSTMVAKFGLKYSQENIELVEYGLFGEAIILAMRKIQKGLRFDLWPRAYSRFVRALLPAMLIATATTVPATPAFTNATSNSFDRNQTTSDTQPLTLVLPAAAVIEADQLAPLPGSAEELHLAYSLTRRQQQLSQQQTKPKNGSSAAITSHNTVYNANQNAYPNNNHHHVPLNRSPSIKKVTFCDESGTSCSDL